MRRNIYIISIKFAAGSLKEFVFLGDISEQYGYAVRYILSKEYKSFGYSRRNMFYLTESRDLKSMVKDIFQLLTIKRGMFKKALAGNPDIIFFYNAHPLNPLISCFFKKKNLGIKIALYLHEPYKVEKKYYGIKKSVYIKIVELIQSFTIKYVDYVILPSKYAYSIFERHYPAFKGKSYLAPLLVPDIEEIRYKDAERRYFSIIGGVNLATGHDDFVKIINYVAERGMNIEFALVSSSDIQNLLSKMSKKAKRIVKIINRNTISDSEINDAIAQSYAVFRLDKEVTQSGVIPVSYMNKTPVIVRGIPGLIQDVIHEENGYILPKRFSMDDVVRSMDYVKNNFRKMSINARKSYEKIWAASNFEKYYGWLLNH
jgi:glycosyltransferase involved in cell wall biosynthesis